MSGATAVPRPLRPKPGPIERKLSVEDDGRLIRCISVGQVAGAWFIAWALTVKVLIPMELIPESAVDEKIERPVLVLLEPRKPASPAKVAKSRPREKDGKEAVSRRPSKENGQIRVEEIASRREKDSGLRKAYEIINDAIKGVDREKIEMASRLTKTDPTRLAGRRGKYKVDFDPGYTDGNGKEGLGLMPGVEPGRISAQPKGPSGISDPGASITVSNEGRFRSSEDILAVVRSHSPGLRHLYNTHLKMNPGLGGKVTVRFAISPSGRVVDAAMVSSTTGSRGFEEQVLSKIQTWRFEPIKAVGNDIVTVPFNFSE